MTEIWEPIVLPVMFAWLAAAISNGYAGWCMVRAMLMISGDYDESEEEYQPKFSIKAFVVLLAILEIAAWVWWLW